MHPWTWNLVLETRHLPPNTYHLMLQREACNLIHLTWYSWQDICNNACNLIVIVVNWYLQHDTRWMILAIWYFLLIHATWYCSCNLILATLYMQFDTCNLILAGYFRKKCELVFFCHFSVPLMPRKVGLYIWEAEKFQKHKWIHPVPYNCNLILVTYRSQPDTCNLKFGFWCCQPITNHLIFATWISKPDVPVVYLAILP